MQNYTELFRATDPVFRPVAIALAAMLFGLTMPLAELRAEDKLDSIVVIVDESVITERDLNDNVQLTRINLAKANRSLPSEEILRNQVLQSLINESLMIQEATRRGIRITDSQLNQAMQQLAQQENMSLSAYRNALLASGVEYDKFRETVRRQIIVQTLRRNYSQRNASVSEAEVDEFFDRTAGTSDSYEYRLSHILISVPDAAAPETVDEARGVASDLIGKLEQGARFDELANTYSTSDTALQGGDLGWRKQAEIPSIFTDDVLKMKVGDHAGPIRSASGFHIVYLADQRDLEQVISNQTRSRHILIRPNELVSEEEARQRLMDFRQRIVEGEDFARLARLYSVDYVSGKAGGDLGWHEPGEMVSEYDSAISQLQIGDLSQPFRSQFGWHLAEVTDQRSVDETEQSKREKIYSQLLRQKQNEVFDLWRRRLRDEAYIVYPDA
jgi:peptidyl-prolyl cis-trans isomerase SurA